MMRLSVVIATRDRAAFLARALDSLDAQRGAPPFEVVIADNGSSDGTRALALAPRPHAPYAIEYVFVPEPNRGAARNAGIAAARGAVVVFVDDDVRLPEGFLAAHDAAHRREVFPLAVSGPILNVTDPAAAPVPTAANYSRAFLCTCNVSVPRSALAAVGGFDASFNLYGWEDTELGLRLRAFDVRRRFAWDAFLWHVKPPHVETFAVVEAKTLERARMAAKLLAKHDGWRTRLATGAYALNFARSALLVPGWSLPLYRKLAVSPAVPAFVRGFARAQVLDSGYTRTLRRALRATAASH